MTIGRVERRKYPRIERKVPLRIKAKTFDAVTTAKNISSSGVLCQIEGYLPLLSKVKIVLFLPSEKKSLISPIDIEGIVVRTKPCRIASLPEVRNIAIFFNKIKIRAAAKISEYINSNLRPLQNPLFVIKNLKPRTLVRGGSAASKQKRKSPALSQKERDKSADNKLP